MGNIPFFIKKKKLKGEPRPTMISGDNETLRTIILLQLGLPTRQFWLANRYVIFFIPHWRLKCIFKGTKETLLIRKFWWIRVSIPKPKNKRNVYNSVCFNANGDEINPKLQIAFQVLTHHINAHSENKTFQCWGLMN